MNNQGFALTDTGNGGEAPSIKLFSFPQSVASFLRSDAGWKGQGMRGDQDISCLPLYHPF